MKTIVVIACLIALVSVAECHNFKSSITAHATRNQRAVDDCYTYECAAIGTRCTQSAACKSCEDQFTACIASTSADLCACGTQLVQCVTINATDDKANCNPTLIYQNCKEQLPTCGCGNFTQIVPIPACNLESFCSNQTGTCQQKTGEGQFCVDDTDCSSLPWAQSSYTCVNNKCEETDYTAPIGDSCTDDDDCVNAFTDEVTCTNGVCVGQGQGGNCTNSGSCNFGLFCNSTGTCTPLLAIGATCDSEGADHCAYPGVCGPEDKCIKAFSKARGQPCNDDFECTIDSACVNDVCAALPAAKACTADSDCPTSQGYTGTCECDQFTGKSMCEIEGNGIASCADEAESFFTCISDNSCNGFDLGSDCVSKNCDDQAKCYFSCALSLSGAPASCYPSLTCGGTTGTTGGSTTGDAVAMQVSMAVIAVAVAALTL